MQALQVLFRKDRRLTCVLFGFDFAFRGNHNSLLAEALGPGPALEGLGDVPGSKLINYEPSLTIAVDEECRTQVRVSTETRTNAFQVRTGEFAESIIPWTVLRCPCDKSLSKAPE